MTATLTHTDLQTINTTISNYNPFSEPPFLRKNHVWGKGFPDLESLNAHASEAVFEALNAIKDNKISATSILITAQDGTGKTHLLSRIRHKLKEDGRALFIFTNEYDDLNNINASFQQILSDSLSKAGSSGTQQWQELAAYMANVAEQSQEKKVVDWIREINQIEEDSEEKSRAYIKKLSKAFRKKRSVNDPDIVKAIFWTLSDEQKSYASNWLAGEELAHYKANELLLPPRRRSFKTIIEILDLISDYKQVIICFDDLDQKQIAESGLHISQVVANLNKSLLENIKKGLVLSVMMPGTWIDRIYKKLPRAVHAKMTTYGKPLELHYMDGDSIIELVRYSLSDYANQHKLILPHPLYPFEESKLRSLGKDRPTVREVLKWCKDNCSPPSSPKSSPIEDAFFNELIAALDSDLNKNHTLAKAISFSLQKLEGHTVEGITISKVEEKVKKGKKKDPYLNFKIIGMEQKSDVCIGIAILQHDGGQALAAGFKRLLDEKGDFSLTRGCLIRSRDKTISRHIKSKYLTPLIAKGGEFVALKPGEIHPLLAIYAVFRKRESDYNVTEEQIADFIRSHGQEQLLGEHNPLLREILSDPSHEVPDLVEEPEFKVEIIMPETNDDDL